MPSATPSTAKVSEPVVTAKAPNIALKEVAKSTPQEVKSLTAEPPAMSDKIQQNTETKNSEVAKSEDIFDGDYQEPVISPIKVTESKTYKSETVQNDVVPDIEVTTVENALKIEKKDSTVLPEADSLKADVTENTTDSNKQKSPVEADHPDQSVPTVTAVAETQTLTETEVASTSLAVETTTVKPPEPIIEIHAVEVEKPADDQLLFDAGVKPFPIDYEKMMQIILFCTDIFLLGVIVFLSFR